MLISLSDSLTANRYAEQHKQDVEKQRTSDLERRDAILKEMDALFKNFKDSSRDEKISFDIPIDRDFVTGIDSSYHYTGVIPPKIYGYVNTSSLNMRSEDNSKSEIIDKLKFQDRVEILFQSDKAEVINNMKSPWLLVRKDSGE